MKNEIIVMAVDTESAHDHASDCCASAADPGTSSDTVIYVSESGDDSAAGDEAHPKNNWCGIYEGS